MCRIITNVVLGLSLTLLLILTFFNNPVLADHIPDCGDSCYAANCGPAHGSDDTSNCCWSCGGGSPLPGVCGTYSSLDEAIESCPSGDPEEPDPTPPYGGPPTSLDYVECTQTSEDEFHSMRPYRASPCNTALQNQSLYCGNDVLLREDFEYMPSSPDGNCSVDVTDPAVIAGLLEGTIPSPFTCEYEVIRGSAADDIPGVEVGIDLSDAELPFMGNTQLVPNQQNNGNPSPENLDYATRMNFYVSWYLNGIPYRAEEEPVDITDDLDEPPIDVNDGSELLTTFGGPIKKLMPDEIQIDKRDFTTGNLGPSGPGSSFQHDQIVRCGTRENPIPCTPPQNETRLSGTDGEDVYVPFSSMEDRLGTLEIDLTTTVQPDSTEENDLIFTIPPTYHPTEGSFNNDIGFPAVGRNADLLFFAHMLEDDELEEYLQQTYMPLDVDQVVAGNAQNEVGVGYYNTDRCDLENARWNSGDDLLGELEPPDAAGDVRYSGIFDCSYTVDLECAENCNLEPAACLDECTNLCEVSSVAALSVYTRSPLADENWNRLVANDQSIFKRFMPRIVPVDDGTGSIVAELLDLPGVTTAHYYSGTDNIDVFAGNLTRSGERADIFIPHLGGINEYFQIQLQNALRPKQFRTFYNPGGVVPGSIPPPDPSQISCEIPPNGSGFCAPDYLASVVPLDPNQALAAAAICNAESGGDLKALNANCTWASDGINNENFDSNPNNDDGPDCVDLDDTAANGCPEPYYDGARGDYSVGLFQINLQPWATSTPRCPGAFVVDKTKPVQWCEVADQNLLDECAARFMDVNNDGVFNIQTAYDLARCTTVNGVQQCNWCSNWSTAAGCGLCQ